MSQKIVQKLILWYLLFTKTRIVSIWQIKQKDCEKRFILTLLINKNVMTRLMTRVSYCGAAKHISPEGKNVSYPYEEIHGKFWMRKHLWRFRRSFIGMYAEYIFCIFLEMQEGGGISVCRTGSVIECEIEQFNYPKLWVIMETIKWFFPAK